MAESIQSGRCGISSEVGAGEGEPCIRFVGHFGPHSNRTASWFDPVLALEQPDGARAATTHERIADETLTAGHDRKAAAHALLAISYRLADLAAAIRGDGPHA